VTENKKVYRDESKEALHEGFDDIGVDLTIEGVEIFLQILKKRRNRNIFPPFSLFDVFLLRENDI
jgi:hypothetical protein